MSVASGEADYSEDSETPDILPILRGGSRLKHAKSDELAGQRERGFLDSLTMFSVMGLPLSCCIS